MILNNYLYPFVLMGLLYISPSYAQETSNSDPYSDFSQQVSEFSSAVPDAAAGRNADMIFQGVGVAYNIGMAVGVHMPQCFTAKPDPMHCAKFGMALMQSLKTGQAMMNSASDRDKLSPIGTDWSTPEFNQFLTDNKNSFSPQELADLQTLGNAYSKGDQQDIANALTKLNASSKASLDKLKAQGYDFDLDNNKVTGPGLDPNGVAFQDVKTAEKTPESLLAKTNSLNEGIGKLNKSLQASLQDKKYSVDPKKAALAAAKAKARDLVSTNGEGSKNLASSAGGAGSFGSTTGGALKFKSFKNTNAKSQDGKLGNNFNQDPSLREKLSGMSRKISDGSSVGVAMDNIFSIVKDRYKTKEQNSQFLNK